MLDPAEQSGTAPERETAELPETIELSSAQLRINDQQPDVTDATPLADSSPTQSLTPSDVRVEPSPRVTTSPDTSAPLWLRRTDQLFVGTLLVVLLTLVIAHWMKLSRWGTASVELTSLQPREYFYSLDINRASWVEWAQLDGIGEKLAKRIVADREERGPFRDANEVGRVRGIYPKQLDSMKPFLRGGTANEATAP